MTTPRRAAAAPKRQPGQPRHVPKRTCVGCRTTAAKRGFVRVVRSADGHVRADPSGKANGRGAYVCASPSCWEVALRRGRLAQSLRVTIEDEDRRALAAFAATLPPDDGVPGRSPDRRGLGNRTELALSAAKGSPTSEEPPAGAGGASNTD